MFGTMMFGHLLVTTLIPGGTGTIITDALSTWANTSNAFDGTTSQTEANSAAANGHGAAPAGTNYIGKDWGSGVAKIITKLVVYGPNNNSLLYGGSGAGTAKLEGSNDNSSWTQLATFSCDGTNSQVVTLTSTITKTTAYRYHRVSSSPGGSVGVAVAEIQFYEDI